MPYLAVKQTLKLTLSALSPLALLYPAASPAGAATYTCPPAYYYAGQKTNVSDVTGLKGNLTDPSVSALPGDSSNHHYDDHILLWLTEIERSPSCYGGLYCWMQAGVGMGQLDTQYNDTQTFEPYFENSGPGNYLQWNYLTGYGLPQDSSIHTEDFYDGATGRDGYPQFQAYVDGTYLGEDVLYNSGVYAEAAAEVTTSNSSSCPTLTSGSPWQDFGTDASGNVQTSDELMLQEGVSNSYHLWSGNPTVFNNPPYYYAQLDGSNAFRTNGPGSGPR